LVLIGALLAVADWRWIGRPIAGPLLVAGMVGGFLLTKLSPFDFVTGGYYMQGALIAAGSALALIGYAFAMIGQLVVWLVGRRGRS
jgi:hypothetical protein